MRAIIVSLLMVFSFNVNAYEVPKDAVIKVFDKSGKQIGEMSRSNYKVVKIDPAQKLHHEAIVKHYQAFKKYYKSNNSVIIHAGIGNNGVKADTNGSHYSVREKKGAVLGATLCSTANKMGVCATGMTNGTITLGIKKDF